MTSRCPTSYFSKIPPALWNTKSLPVETASASLRARRKWLQRQETQEISESPALTALYWELCCCYLVHCTAIETRGGTCSTPSSDSAARAWVQVWRGQQQALLVEGYLTAEAVLRHGVASLDNRGFA